MEPRPVDVHAFKSADNGPVAWIVADRPMAYETAVAAMERRVERIAQGEASECVWLLEHPPVYTAGTSAQARDLVGPPPFPVHQTGRGGQYTYHGPGQRVAYVMLDLKRRSPDLRAYVGALEAWIIATLARFNIRGEQRKDRVGVWVRRPDKRPGLTGAPAEDKIAAIGVRVRRWVSFHGIAINCDPDLSHFAGIVPCGIAQPEFGVTSFFDLGQLLSMPELDVALRVEFEAIFGATVDDAHPLS